ncbi:MAG: SPOR domain-containing protein [Ignavibacteriae bacterium]|nr:SPOR domain-containing protein [Ignavibacteriota bacterium]
MGCRDQQIVRQILLSLLVMLWGCGSSKETEKRTATTPSNEMENFEAKFRPSDYDVDMKVFFSELRRATEQKSIPSEPTVTEAPIIIPGFRVQLISTTNIDEANAKKAEAEAAFPTEWFYIAYDPPSYKLRAGNFQNRADAESYAAVLSSNGFPDAWIVPEKIIKNIHPKVVPPQEQIPPR